jgi:hypothetical protein
MSAKMPILVVDFDGVLHSYRSGWQGADVVADGPVPGAMAFLVEAVRHFDVRVLSSRSSQQGGIGAMKRALAGWLQADGRPDWVIDRLGFPREKPAAHLTIDDRALCFEGTFPDPAALLSFRPWNKRTEEEDGGGG